MIAIGNNSADDASRQRQRSELIERRTGGYSIDIGDRSKARQPSGSNYGGFPNIAAIVLLIAIADVLFVGYSIDASLGGGDGNNEPHRHLGAEAGLHRFHEKTRLKQLQDEHDIMKHNRTVNSIESTGVGSTLLRPNKEVVEGENRARLITSNSNGDIIESVKTPLVQKDQQYRGIDERISKILISANAEVDEETLSKLPTWDDVISQYGEKPIIYGLETCEAYRQSVKPEDRMIGPAGIFNTGTNLLFQLMKENCDIRDAFLSKTHREPKRNGIRWQAPWGKHNTPSTHRLKHVATFWGEGINHTAFFPVVMIKDPYGWMGSQCRHPYQAHWDHKVGNCPNLIHFRSSEILLCLRHEFVLSLFSVCSQLLETLARFDGRQTFFSPSVLSSETLGKLGFGKIQSVTCIVNSGLEESPDDNALSSIFVTILELERINFAQVLARTENHSSDRNRVSFWPMRTTRLGQCSTPRTNDTSSRLW